MASYIPNHGITSYELFEYYNEHGITDFPIRKDGLPAMNRKQNKDMAMKVMRERIKLIERNQNLHNISKEKEVNYRKEITDMTDENIDEMKKEIEDIYCVICGESMETNRCKLACNHSFCVSCIAQHSRENNNCPMCRDEYCPKPRKMDRISMELLHNITQYEFTYSNVYGILNDTEHLLNINQCIHEEIEDFTNICRRFERKEITEEVFNDYRTEMLKLMYTNIFAYATNCGTRVMNFYNNQL